MNYKGMNKNKIFNIGIWLVFTILFLRLFQVQILKHKYYYELSLKNYLKPLKLHAPRGDIYDRKGKLLAHWEPVFRVSLIPDLIPPEGLKKLKEILGRLDVDPETLKIKSNYITIKTGIPFHKALIIEENYEEFPSVVVDADPSRVYYPQFNYLSHIIGYVGEASQEEIEKFNLSPGDVVGKSGVEAVYDTILRGRDGYRFIAMDSKGAIVDLNPRPPIPPVKGKSLRLTIDSDLTHYIDSLFLPYKKGACVVYNPITGDIYSLYSKPYFSSSLIKLRWEDYLKDPSSPLINRTIQGLYPPGSVFKPISALIGLASGKIEKNTVFYCPGSYRFGRRVWKCWKSSGHGSLDLIQAIAQSCDVYFYQLGLTVGLENFLNILKDFRLPIKTGIDLPGEYQVLLPDVDYYRKKYGDYGFTEGYVMNLAIGQGEVLLTPIWIAVVTGIIANRGVSAIPHLLADHNPGYIKWDLPREDFEIVREGMLQVIKGEHGTASFLYSPQFSFAGKTGTAQNPHGKDHSLFTCFSPYDNPQIVITVVVENAGHGSEAAAPIAAKILERWYEKK